MLPVSTVIKLSEDGFNWFSLLGELMTVGRVTTGSSVNNGWSPNFEPRDSHPTPGCWTTVQICLHDLYLYSAYAAHFVYHTYIHVYMYTYIQKCIYTYIHVHIHVYTKMHIYIYTYIHCTCTHIHIYIYTHTHVNVHACEEVIDKSNSTSPFPVIVIQGSLQAPEESWIVANYQVLFKFSGAIVECTVVLLATYYVFMYRYPASLNIVFYIYKNVFCKLLTAETYQLL